MRIRFPFIYNVNAYPPRKQYVSTYPILGWEWFDIKEIQSQQAPVAIKAQTADLGNIKKQTRETIYRSFDKKLISQPKIKWFVKNNENLSVVRASKSDDLKIENFQQFLNKWAEDCTNKNVNKIRTQVFPFNDGRTYASVSASETTGPFNPKRIDSSEKQQTLSEIAKFLKQCVFVDGEFYRSSEGPAWVLVEERMNDVIRPNLTNLQSLVLAAELSDLQTNYRNFSFTLENHDKAQALLNKNLTEPEKIFRRDWVPTEGNLYLYPAEIGSAEVYIQPTKSFNKQVLEKSEHLISQMKPWVGDMKRDLILKYVDIRERIGRTKETVNRKAILYLLDDVIELCDLWKNYCTHTGLDYHPLVEQQLKHFAQPEPEIVIDHSDPDALEVSLDDLDSLSIQM